MTVINECQTRLDTEDIQMWREAGLLIDDNGIVRRNDPTAIGKESMELDMICNALVWLISKLVNFVAAGESFQPVPAGYRPPNAEKDEPLKIGVSQQKLLLERWVKIKDLLETWYNGLSDEFKPCARIEPSMHNSQEAYHVFTEIWYSLPMCSSSMQHYHMAQIFLLINRPHESTARRSNIFLRLQSYRSIDAEIMYHCREIWYAFMIFAQYIIIDSNQWHCSFLPGEFESYPSSKYPLFCFLPVRDLILLPDSASVCRCSMSYRCSRETSDPGSFETNRSRSRLGDQISGSASS